MDETPGNMAGTPGQVNVICQQLIQAVTVMMQPESSQEYRMEALRFCEDFKEKCPDCVPCGLHLAERTQPPVVRHFGLQVLEHVVKFQWNNMSREDKMCLKNSVITLMSSGIHSILEEEGHIKDVIARIVVEMIKREWPQHWPEMLTELETLTKHGEAQTELVMFILLRLAEDVVTFHTLPTQRRRDIQSTMTQNMDKLFAFMLNILQESVRAYQQLKADPAQKEKAKGLCRVAVSALNTLAGYVDWVSINHITDDNCKLLEMLCLLLGESELQVEAAECLLISVSRKGKLEDRVPLLLLFGDTAMNYIMCAAQMVDGEMLLEKRYVFLKRLCQVLCALGNQICALTGSPDIKVTTPDNFCKYLDSLMGFTRHPSQFLRSSTLMTWGALFRHEVLSRDPQLMAVVPEFLQVSMTNVVKVGFPSKNDSLSCEYSRLDCDNDEDFIAFFTTFRSMMGDVMRAACRLDPRTGFSIALDWLKYQISAPLDLGSQNNKCVEDLCTVLSPSFIQWDAMTFYCECVTSQLFKALPKEELPVKEGIEILQAILGYNTTDPLILSCVLTNLSCFFPFVSYASDFLPMVMGKLFSAVTFELGKDSKAPRTRSVRNVRRYACSSIFKICRDYPELVLPNFELLYSHVKQLLSDDLQLTQMEKCSILESVVVVSNRFKNYERQRAFLAELLNPFMPIWQSEEIQRAISSPDEFISFVGAANLKGERHQEDVWRKKRTQLCYCVYSAMAVLKRAHWPTDPEEAKAGGFLVGYTLTGTAIYRNPCSEQILKLLDYLFVLMRTHNNLYLPEIKLKMGEFFCKALDMLEPEKKCLLGISQSSLDGSDRPVYKTELEWIQGFLCTLYENCYNIMGTCGPSMQQDFYSIPDLGSRLLGSVFANLENVPNYRLRPILRLFVRPLVLSCPPEQYESLLCPILGPLITYLHQRLSHQWMCFSSIDQESTDDNEYSEDNIESQEILEDQLVRLLTREVIDLISVCCVAKKTSDHSTVNAGVDGVQNTTHDVEDEEMMTMDTVVAGSLELTELGKILMGHEEVCKTLLITAYSPLLWKDSIACQKTTTQLCWTLLKQVISGLPSEAALCFFTNVLRGLQVHGQHASCLDALVNLAFHIYEDLRPRFPELRALMEQIPDIQTDSLETFDTKLLFPTQKITDKKKKEHFKRLLGGCIGKPLGEQFRKEVHIRNLPSLFQKKTRTELQKDPILGICTETLSALFQD
ncbi:exportin-5 isoform 2-T2 [Discoglossus pictus]